MTFAPDQTEALKAPLNAKHIKARSQAGRSLSYIEGWWAISEANRIFGFDGWDRRTHQLHQLGDPREVDGKWRIAYMARVRVTVAAGDKMVVREGCGYGSGIDRDLGQAHESAIKEAETDAMKRALMTFGNPFGLALYDKEQNGVEHDAPPQKAAPQPEPTAPPQPPGKMTPAQWVDRASKELLECRTPADLTAWLQKNSAAVDKLQETDKALYNAINVKIMNRNQELQDKAA